MDSTDRPSTSRGRRLAGSAFPALVAGLAVVLALFAHPVETAEARATAVAQRFFAAMDDRRWDDVCELLSHDFHERNNLTNEKVCFMALHLGFTLRENFEFRMGEVERKGPDVLVHATADGEPGVIRLVREDGAFRVDSLAAEAGG